MRSEIQAWWQQAKADVRTAEVNLKGERYYEAVFFCQQAVEKALKAYILRRSRNPQSPAMLSHSLIFLAKQALLPDRFHSFLRELTSEYVSTRYRSAAEEAPKARYDRAIATETLSATEEVVGWNGSS